MNLRKFIPLTKISHVYDGRFFPAGAFEKTIDKTAANLVSDSRSCKKNDLVVPPVNFYFPQKSTFLTTAVDAYLPLCWKENTGDSPYNDTALRQVSFIFDVILKSIEDKASAFLCPVFLKSYFETGMQDLQSDADRRGQAVSESVMAFMDVKTKFDKKITKSGFCVIFINDYLSTCGEICSSFFGHPDQNIQIIGVSGTNGKTSTIYMLFKILQEVLGKKRSDEVALLGTLGFKIGNEKFEETGFTSPQIVELFSFLDTLRRKGVKYLLMELSSHGAVLGRFSDLQLNGLIMTSLSQDHLDFHGSLKNYFDAKAEIVATLERSRKENRILVLRRMSDHENEFCRSLLTKNPGLMSALNVNIIEKVDLQIGQSSRKLLFRHFNFAGQANITLATKDNEKSASFDWVTELPAEKAERYTLAVHELNIYSCRFSIHNRDRSYHFLISPGVLFQVLNSGMALICIQRMFGDDDFSKNFETIASSLEKPLNIPGRFDLLQIKKKKFTNCWAVVDYAHSPDALENLLSFVAAIKKGRLMVLFGCGGDRDKGKRPKMGAAVETYADVLILTNDNPRTEDPLGIIEDIKVGIKEKEYLVETDRKKAIRMGYDMAQEDDILVIAGKGHETYQIIGKKKYPFNDKEIIVGLDT